MRRVIKGASEIKSLSCLVHFLKEVENLVMVSELRALHHVGALFDGRVLFIS